MPALENKRGALLFMTYDSHLSNRVNVSIYISFCAAISCVLAPYKGLEMKQ